MQIAGCQMSCMHQKFRSSAGTVTRNDCFGLRKLPDNPLHCGGIGISIAVSRVSKIAGIEAFADAAGEEDLFRGYPYNNIVHGVCGPREITVYLLFPLIQDQRIDESLIRHRKSFFPCDFTCLPACV